VAAGASLGRQGCQEGGEVSQIKQSIEGGGGGRAGTVVEKSYRNRNKESLRGIPEVIVIGADQWVFPHLVKRAKIAALLINDVWPAADQKGEV